MDSATDANLVDPPEKRTKIPGFIYCLGCGAAMIERVQLGNQMGLDTESCWVIPVRDVRLKCKRCGRVRHFRAFPAG
jgi:hypothetical protein